LTGFGNSLRNRRLLATNEARNNTMHAWLEEI